MKKLSLVIITLALSVLNTGLVRADDGVGKGGNDARSDRQLTLDQFRDLCAHPGSDPLAQIVPQHITLQCQDISRHYVPVAPGQVAADMSSHRVVMAGILSDKGQVGSMSKDETGANGAAGQKGGECLRYKEVEETVGIETSITCGEILSIKGDIEDYCASITESAKGGSPKLVHVEDTGASIDTCQNVTKTPGKPMAF